MHEAMPNTNSQVVAIGRHGSDSLKKRRDRILFTWFQQQTGVPVAQACQTLTRYVYRGHRLFTWLLSPIQTVTSSVHSIKITLSNDKPRE